jgi:CspA family cold shock protein
MTKGFIKWFNSKKGFGFIRQEKGDDVFFNHSALNLGSQNKLTVGDMVIFEVDEELLGLSAKNVQRL